MANPDPPPIEDVVVVIPGILGTQLYKDDSPIWALSGKALWKGLRSLGGSVKELTLPAGIGDCHPGDGIEPRGLMPDFHGIPRLGPFIGGYSDLSHWLRETLQLRTSTPGEAGNLLEFGYDWRLSNRYNSALLKVSAETALTRWQGAGHKNAKLVFFCHSMGGLVARHYLESRNGAEFTRALVTVGTPHRGSLKALDNLVNGRQLSFGPVKLDVAALVRSFPSAYQLLPTYDCLCEDGGLSGLRGANVPHLDPNYVEDALDFHDEIAAREKKNGATPYEFRMVVGTRQPTFATARLSGGAIEPLLTIDGNDERGDGTVSRFASIPTGVSPTDMRQLSSSKRHGWLQQSTAVLDDFYGILTAKERVYMSDVPDLEQAPGLELPEVVAPGDSLSVRASSSQADLLLFAELTAEDGTAVARKDMQPDDTGKYSVAFDPPGEGAYIVTVSGVQGKARFDPVSEGVLVAEIEPKQ